MKFLVTIMALALTIINLNAVEIDVSKGAKSQLYIKSDIEKFILTPTILNKSYRSFRFKADDPETGTTFTDASGSEATVNVSYEKQESNKVLVTYKFNFTDRSATRAHYVRLRFPSKKWLGSELKLDRKVVPFGDTVFKETHGYARTIELFDTSKQKAFRIYARSGLDFTVTDLRRWNDPKFELRVRLGKNKDELKFLMEVAPE